jgi:hypothetical protein
MVLKQVNEVKEKNGIQTESNPRVACQKFKSSSEQPPALTP